MRLLIAFAVFVLLLVGLSRCLENAAEAVRAGHISAFEPRHE